MFGNRFYVHVAGKTNGAHLEYITNLNRIGQIEVFSPEESDYIVVFCPIASRVGTDVGEALESLPGRKGLFVFATLLLFSSSPAWPHIPSFLNQFISV